MPEVVSSEDWSPIHVDWTPRHGQDAEGPQVVRWVWNGIVVEKCYDRAVRSVVTLDEQEAVLIVEPATFEDLDDAGDNAVIYAANGELRTRLRHPRQPRWPYSRAGRAFDQAFYTGEDLHLVVWDHGSQYRCSLRDDEVEVISEFR